MNISVRQVFWERRLSLQCRTSACNLSFAAGIVDWPSRWSFLSIIGPLCLSIIQTERRVQQWNPTFKKSSSVTRISSLLTSVINSVHWLVSRISFTFFLMWMKTLVLFLYLSIPTEWVPQDHFEGWVISQKLFLRHPPDFEAGSDRIFLFHLP